MKIGVTQFENSIDFQNNLKNILNALNIHKDAGADFVLFPECTLTGFSGNVRNLNFEEVQSAFAEIQEEIKKIGISTLVPSALKNEQNQFLNSGYLFLEKQDPVQIFKEGLTESEKKFFVPQKNTSRFFSIQGFNLAFLICAEAADPTWQYFDSTNIPDAVLWPGYWGWESEDAWNEGLHKMGETVHSNMKHWKVPLIQATFTENAVQDGRVGGPSGRSIVVDSDNQTKFTAAYQKTDHFVVSLAKDLVNGCRITDVKTVIG